MFAPVTGALDCSLVDMSSLRAPGSDLQGPTQIYPHEPANWESHSLPDYPEALATWLEDSEGSYANQGVPSLWNGW